MNALIRAVLLCLVSMAVSGAFGASSQTPGAGAPEAGAQTVVHVLDYVAVDYAGAVQGGKVRNEDEFREMIEFAGQVTTSLKTLPPNPRQAALIDDAGKLARMVQEKASGADVAAAARKLRWDVIGAYSITVAPKTVPDFKAGAKLYQAMCAGCHGTEGRGDGPAALKLDPKPSDFHDRSRMTDRSVFGLYNTVTLGVKGTAMAAYGQLTEEERWALAFHVARLSVAGDESALGEKLWKEARGKQAFPDLVNVVALSSNEVKERYGEEMTAVQNYLIAHPDAVARARPAPIAFTVTKLDEAVAAYREGEREAALQLAVTAYVEGYELIEKSLAIVDEKLMREGERNMMDLRALIRDGAPAGDVDAQAKRVATLLERARERLDVGALSAETVFTSAFFILLREGLEALLVVAAIFAFLVKANRRDALVWVHAGWITAVALGIVTWAVASYVIAISGAHREITEGVTGLIAAAMLVYVGYWLHSKSSADAWQAFVKDSVGAALASRTLWAMAAVSFLAVYREIFETVLFYQALWIQAGESGSSALVGGLAAAAAALAAIGWGIFRYSLRLPLGPFFTAMSWLMCVLAVVLAGKGVASLQEAGMVGANLIGVPSLPVPGIFPTVQTLAAQAAVIACIAALLYFGGNGKAAPQSSARKA